MSNANYEYLLGTRGKKDSFPEPWASFPDSIFAINRYVYNPANRAEHFTLFRNVIRMINALQRGNELSIGFSETDESPSIHVARKEDNDSITWVVFYPETATMKGCSLSPIDGMPGEYSTQQIKMVYASSEKSSPSAAVISDDDSENGRHAGLCALTAVFVAAAYSRTKKGPSFGIKDLPSAVISLFPTRINDVLTHAEAVFQDKFCGPLKAGTSITEQSKSGDYRFKIASLSKALYDLLMALKSGECIEHSCGTGNKYLNEISDADIKISMGAGFQRVLSSLPEVGVYCAENDDLPYMKFASPATEPSVSVTVEDGDELRMTSLDELRKKYPLEIHELTEAEKQMIPHLDEHYVVDEQLEKVARLIHRDWKCEDLGLAPNIILEGDAGSGKTTASLFLADVFGMPRTKMTMSPTFESANLIGAFYPVFEDIEDWHCDEQDKAAILAAQQAISDMRGSASSSLPIMEGGYVSLSRAFSCEPVLDAIRTSYGIPSEEEIEIAPEDAWQQLGHSSDEEAPIPSAIHIEARKLFNVKMNRVRSIVEEQEKSGSISYRFILSELMRAFKYGWLLEIQEAASVQRPGVLTELNSLLEPNGRIELPNGEMITRHPDTIVVFTTNRGYAGNFDLNESLRDRCTIGVKMDLPTPNVMAARAMAKLNWDGDPKIPLACARTIQYVSDLCKQQGIKGAYGMRSLVGWLSDIKDDIDPLESFEMRVIYKMTTQDDEVQILRDAFKSSFEGKKKGKAAGA